MNPRAEQMRIRYLYRRMILSGEIKVDRHTAKKLIGPDCAYHLYGRLSPEGEEKGNEKKRKVTRGKWKGMSL
jgi:hypothetical protein